MELKKSDLKNGDILKTKSGGIYIYLGDCFLDINNAQTIKADVYDEQLNHFSENNQICLASTKSATENWKNFILKENPNAWTWERNDEVKYIGLRETADSEEKIFIISKAIEVNKGDIVSFEDKRYIITDVGLKDKKALQSSIMLKDFKIEKLEKK